MVEYNWEVWKFSRVPNGYWEDSQNQRAVFDYIYKRLGLKTLKDWYSVKSGFPFFLFIHLGEDIQFVDGKRVLDFFGGSIKNAIMSVYPEVEWNEELFLQQRVGMK